MFAFKRSETLLVSAALVMALAAGLAGCGSSDNNSPVTTYGATSPLGNGTARAYLTTRNGVPISAGVEITAAALQNLPTPPQGQLATEIALQSPSGLSTTPFQQVTLFYSPGHPPPNQQEVPHMHPTWFLITPAQRQTLLPPGAGVAVAAANLPANTTTGVQAISPPSSFIPTVGDLYIDPTEPGYTQTPFTTIEDEYRFYNGQMVAVALGVANAFFTTLTQPGQAAGTANLPLPQQYPVHGYFPTHYTVSYNASRGVYDMAIDTFVLR